MGGGRDRNWKSVGLGLNKQLRGWIAGAAVRLTVHQSKPSKVCIRAYRGKKTACEKCEQAKPLTGLIFVPFYPEDNQLRCVLHVHDECEKALASLDLHDYFAAWRGNESDVGVQLKRLEPQTTYRTTIATRRASADISDWLVGFMGVRGELSAEDLIAGAQFVECASEVPAVSASAEVEESASGRDVVRSITAGMSDQFKLRGGVDAELKVWTETTPQGKIELKTNLPERNGKH